MKPSQSSKRFLGITVVPYYVLYEGIEKVLKNLVNRADVTAVACSPSIGVPAREGEGRFQPPDDAGSSPRIFDRPLWNKKALWIRSAPSFYPCESYYSETPYDPPQPNDLTRKYGHIVKDFIDAACDYGLKVYLQIGASSPPGLHDEDLPLLPNGCLPKRMANIGSLASEAIRSYNRAYIRDLLENYPQIAGVRLDWPEYPCYMIDEAFQDFSSHVQKWAEMRGFDFGSIRQKVGDLYDYLHGGLTNRELAEIASPDRGKFLMLRLLRRSPETLEWLRLKSALSLDLLRDWRDALTLCGGEDKELSANAFSPPFSILTGFDFYNAADYCSAVSPKLYTMHWSMMVEFWGSELLAANPGLEESILVKALAHLFDLGDEITAEKISDYGYPKPNEPHPIPNEAQYRKIEQVIAEAAGRVQVTPIVHGYGPLEDFCRRLEVVAESSADGVWINRYGYLSDEKLDAIGEIWR